MIKLGRIYACIDGDHRYGTTIEVHADSKSIQIKLISTSPVGGMDGPPGTVTDPAEVLETIPRSKTAPVRLIAALKHHFKTADCGVIARYGTPTKKFTWFHDGTLQAYGLNVGLASAALARVPMSTEADQVHQENLATSK